MPSPESGPGFVRDCGGKDGGWVYRRDPQLNQGIKRRLVLAALVCMGQGAASQPTTFRGVWYLEGPRPSRVPPDYPGNALRLVRGELVLELADGQTERFLAESITSIRYFRSSQRGPMIAAGGELIPVVLPGIGMFHKETRHFVDVSFTTQDNRQSALRLGLDKRVYRPALESLQRLTSRPILVSAGDSNALPRSLPTELTERKPAPFSRRPIEHPARAAVKLAVDDDTRLLAGVLRDGSVQIWDLESGAALYRWQTLEPSARTSIAFRPRTGFLITSSPTTGVRQWEISTGRPYGEPIQPAAAPRAVIVPMDLPSVPFRFQPDGMRLIVGSDRSCWAFNEAIPTPCGEAYSRALQVEASPLSEWEARYTVPEFNASGTELAMSSRQYSTSKAPSVVVKVLEWPKGSVVRQAVIERQAEFFGFVDIERIVTATTWSVNGHRLALWRLGAKAAERVWEVKYAKENDTFAMSPEFIAAGGRGRELFLLSTATGRLQAKVPTSSWTSALTFLPDGRLAVAADDGSVSIWNTSTKRLVRVLAPVAPLH